ncbi:hypothetical protein SprV_0401713200 [Sparganum proliferum]
MKHLATVFDSLQQYGGVLNPSMCVFDMPSLEFPGHLADSSGIHTLPSEAAALRDFQTPSSKHQLQRYLGMFNFYHRFHPHCANTILPLTSLLSGPKRSFELSADVLAAFDTVKAALADATLLKHFSPAAPIAIMVDACNVAVGAVLQQHLTGHTQHLTSWRRKLSPAGTRYSTFARELLPVFLAVNHFRHFLEGRDFTVSTDHKPLSFALKPTPDKLSPREIRQVGYISQLTPDIRHIDGSRNEVADARPRPPRYSPSSDSQRDSQAVSPPADGLPTHRRLSGELDGPPPLGSVVYQLFSEVRH